MAAGRNPFGGGNLIQDVRVDLQQLLQRIDDALGTAPVQSDERERDRLMRWRREILLRLADDRRQG